MKRFVIEREIPKVGSIEREELRAGASLTPRQQRGDRYLPASVKWAACATIRPDAVLAHDSTAALD